MASEAFFNDQLGALRDDLQRLSEDLQFLRSEIEELREERLADHRYSCQTRLRVLAAWARWQLYELRDKRPELKEATEDCDNFAIRTFNRIDVEIEHAEAPEELPEHWRAEIAAYCEAHGISLAF